MAEKLAGLSAGGRRLYGRICKRADGLWGDIVQKAGDGKVVLQGEGFSSLGPGVQVEIVRRALVSIGSGEQNLKSGQKSNNNHPCKSDTP